MYIGNYDCQEWREDWNKESYLCTSQYSPWFYPTLRNLKIIQGEGKNPTKILESKYPKTLDAPSGGNNWKYSLGEDFEELYVSFKVKFGEDFIDNRGGKLHGFCGEECYTGGINGDNGWSSRTTFADGRGIYFYIYYPGKDGVYGDSCTNPGSEDLCWMDITNGEELFEFIPGVWYTFTHRIVMNEPGVENGIIEGFIDGKLVSQRTNAYLRGEGKSYGIDKFYFCTFFGGSRGCEDYNDEDCDAPNKKDEYIYFDDFVIFDYKEGISVARGNIPWNSKQKLISPF